MKRVIRFFLSLSFLLLSFCSHLHAHALQKSFSTPVTNSILKSATHLQPEAFKIQHEYVFKTHKPGIRIESSKISTTDDDDEDDKVCTDLKKNFEPWNVLAFFSVDLSSEFLYSCIIKCHVASKQHSCYILPKYITLRVMRV